MLIFQSSIHRPHEVKAVRRLAKRGVRLSLLYTYWDVYPGKPSKSGLAMFKKVAKVVKQ